MSKKAIMIGASSDIGTALCLDWTEKNWKVSGTYRTDSDSVKSLKSKNISLVKCDLTNPQQIDVACQTLSDNSPDWDVLVLGPGLITPIGLFSENDMDEWAESVEVNFTNQLRIVHRLLPFRNQKSSEAPTVLFFAGGGTNSAPPRFSAYTVSKIALIKMTELLAAEIPDVKFVILGPGWVNTKIHQATLDAGNKAGAALEKTIEKLEGDSCAPMESVVKCCHWLILGSKDLLTGRNFSLAGDKWGTNELDAQLAGNPDMFKLRRAGNDIVGYDDRLDDGQDPR